MRYDATIWPRESLRVYANSEETRRCTELNFRLRSTRPAHNREMGGTLSKIAR